MGSGLPLSDMFDNLFKFRNKSKAELRYKYADNEVDRSVLDDLTCGFHLVEI